MAWRCMAGRARRHTGDRDIWICRKPQAASRLMVVLREFGLGDAGLLQQDFELPHNVIQLGYPPFHINLLTEIDGVDFDAAWSNRETTIHDVLPIHFVGLSDLEANRPHAIVPAPGEGSPTQRQTHVADRSPDARLQDYCQLPQGQRPGESRRLQESRRAVPAIGPDPRRCFVRERLVF